MIMWLAAVAIREINHDSGSATFRTPRDPPTVAGKYNLGHPFIKSSYWRDCIPLVRDAYLANAQNWVWEEDGKLLGFVSIMEGRFLAAMFVAPKAVRRGIGKALMQYVQQRHPHLMLEVYQKNQPAIDFYHAQGFHIVDCAWQDETTTLDYELVGGSNAVSVSSGPLYFSSHASAVLPAQPFPSRELGRSLVSTFTAPFLQMPPAVKSRSYHAPS